MRTVVASVFFINTLKELTDISMWYVKELTCLWGKSAPSWLTWLIETTCYQIAVQVAVSCLFVLFLFIFFLAPLNFLPLSRQRRRGESLNIRMTTYAKCLGGTFHLAVSLAVGFCHCPSSCWEVLCCCFHFLLNNHLALSA